MKYPLPIEGSFLPIIIYGHELNLLIIFYDEKIIFDFTFLFLCGN
jgi:hypothetical protein